MNLKGFIVIIIILVTVGGGLYLNSVVMKKQTLENERDATQQAQEAKDLAELHNQQMVEIIPISHASAVIIWDSAVIYTDPVGGKTLFDNQPKPDIILLTDIHGDHLDIETLENIVSDNTVLVAPNAVAEQLPAFSENNSEPLASRAVVLSNGDTSPQLDFMVTAIPMYNLPESEDAFHTKGRGNGYILEKNTFRIYIAGDTADIPEMRQLKNIDIALIPMNLPFTMDVETAADAVLAFKPNKVYPYHYRGRDGLSDVSKFKQIVNEGDKSIEVVQLDWYKE